MSLGIRLLAEPVRSLASGTIGAGYMGIGTGFDHPIRIVFIQNLTDATLMFSLDGIEDHFPLPANGFLLLDITANKNLSQGFYLAEGQRIYVQTVGAPTTGDVYVSAFYSFDQ